MITACELCAKIAAENALRDEATRIAKIKAAKSFVENIISPILTTLTEVPNHFKIGYRYHSSNSEGLFQGISDWEYSTTSRGYIKKSRWFTNHLFKGGDYSFLDYELVNQYLAEFGFQISVEYEKMIFTEYSSGYPDCELTVDVLYLSMACPLEIL